MVDEVRSLNGNEERSLLAGTIAPARLDSILMEQKFRDWLLQRGNTGAANSYPKAIRIISEHCSTETGYAVDIYAVSNQHLISELAHDYSQAGRFSGFGYEQHGRFRAAIARYSEFFVQHVGGDALTEGSIEEDSSTDGAKDTGNNFAYEKDLQTSLCAQISELFAGYQIYGGALGIEYSIGGKRIDVLLEHEESGALLAVELKSGTADYKVFGQISMYLGLLKEQFPDKQISGVVIAGCIDSSLKHACAITDRITLKVYRMSLELEDA